MSSSQPRIAIIGGGPAGLSLGLLLHNHQVPFTIFELRDKPTDEELDKPSGMLDLHDESGLATISECGLSKEFVQLTGECSEAQKVADKDGNILYRDEGGLSDRPEISRHALTKLLISHLPEASVKWGSKIFSVIEVGTADQPEIQLDLGPYGKQNFDLVIGADGAWSRVRALLTNEKPHYTGKHNITLTVRNITTKYPHLAELVGLGSFSALGLKHGVMSQRGPHDSARIYVFLTSPDENFPKNSGLADLTAALAKDQLLNDDALLGQWGTLMKDLVTVACDEETADQPGSKIDLKTMFELPIGNSWQHKAGATLVGDAAHLMGPWAGEGVNLAMWDSRLLAHAIIKAYQTADQDATLFRRVVDPLIREFEVEMVARSKEKAEETQGNGEMMFGDNAANDFVNFFLSAYGQTGI